MKLKNAKFDVGLSSALDSAGRVHDAPRTAYRMVREIPAPHFSPFSMPMASQSPAFWCNGVSSY